MPEVRVLGDAERRAEIRRGIEAGRGDRHRQELQPAIRLAQVVAADDDLLAARGFGLDWRDRMRDRLHPALADVRDLGAHAERIDFRRRRDRADDHRHVVFAAGRVDDIREQEGAALGLWNAADELQPDQRMQLGVLVDRMIDPRQQPPGLKVRKVLLQVEPRPGFDARLGSHVVHIVLSIDRPRLLSKHISNWSHSHHLSVSTRAAQHYSGAPLIRDPVPRRSELGGSERCTVAHFTTAARVRDTRDRDQFTE